MIGYWAAPVSDSTFRRDPTSAPRPVKGSQCRSHWFTYRARCCNGLAILNWIPIWRTHWVIRFADCRRAAYLASGYLAGYSVAEHTAHIGYTKAQEVASSSSTTRV